MSHRYVIRHHLGELQRQIFGQYQLLAQQYLYVCAVLPEAPLNWRVRLQRAMLEF
jgi:hypothetical protein